MCDLDGGGSIDRGELSTLLSALGMELDEHEVSLSLFRVGVILF